MKELLWILAFLAAAQYVFVTTHKKPAPAPRPAAQLVDAPVKAGGVERRSSLLKISGLPGALSR